jgi:hypothetical protein
MADPKPTKEQLAAIMGELSPADRKILEAHMKGGGRARRTGEAVLLDKYPHMVEGSLVFNEKTNKQEVTIQCTHPGCETERKVATSDLFQVNMCDDHRKEQAKAKKAARDARVKAILAEAEKKEVPKA